MPKKIIAAKVKRVAGTMYPPPYDKPCRARSRASLGGAAGLTQFGVNYLRLPPGAWSSQRHWQTRSDEFVYVLAGEVVLVTDAGEEVLGPGDAAGFKGGDPDGHHLQNRSKAEAVVLEVGSRIKNDGADYPGIDLKAPEGGKPAMYTHADGRAYKNLKRRGPKAK